MGIDERAERANLTARSGLSRCALGPGHVGELFERERQPNVVVGHADLYELDLRARYVRLEIEYHGRRQVGRLAGIDGEPPSQVLPRQHDALADYQVENAKTFGTLNFGGSTATTVSFVVGAARE